MKQGRREIGSRLVLAVAVAVLPLLVLAPVMSGVTVVHDHGEGYHGHRRLSRDHSQPASRSTWGTHHHGEDHDHGVQHSHELGHDTSSDDRRESAAFDRDDEPSGIVIVVPQVMVTKAPSAAPLASILRHLPALDALKDRPLIALGGPRAPRARGPCSDRRRKAKQALLLTNHAILV